VKNCSPPVVNSNNDDTLYLETPETPKNFENLVLLRKNVEKSLTRQEEVDTYTKLSIQKIADAAENAFAERGEYIEKKPTNNIDWDAQTLVERELESRGRTGRDGQLLVAGKLLSLSFWPY
jgi:hypothetical protein